MMNLNKILGKKKGKGLLSSKPKLGFGGVKMTLKPSNKLNMKLKMPKLNTGFKKPMGASIQKQRQWKGFNSNMKIAMRNIHKDTDGDRVPDRFDCQPRNAMRQDSIIPERSVFEDADNDECNLCGKKLTGKNKVIGVCPACQKSEREDYEEMEARKGFFGDARELLPDFGEQHISIMEQQEKSDAKSVDAENKRLEDEYRELLNNDIRDSGIGIENLRTKKRMKEIEDYFRITQ